MRQLPKEIEDVLKAAPDVARADLIETFIFVAGAKVAQTFDQFESYTSKMVEVLTAFPHPGYDITAIHKAREFHKAVALKFMEMVIPNG